MRAWLDAVLAVVLAPSCAACHETLRRPTCGCVCSSCWNSVITQAEPHCDRCGDCSQPQTISSSSRSCVRCADTTAHVTRARAIGPYAGALRDIVHALKYDGRRSLAKPLAERMRHVGEDLVLRASVAVPVPLHPARRRERGFNQAADLAHHIGLPVVSALSRVRATPSQTTLHAVDRHANVHGAFRATRRVHDLRGATVLVVDDVRTTGATLEACASVLTEAGVREVLALTAARVESSQP
ncbi:MAG: ComF family protein [Vicinamibacterales bacterium]